VLTALPPLMLMAGLWVYYRTEQAQLAGPPLLQEQVSFNGTFKGLSSLRSLGEQQLFFWLETTQRSRGLRIDAQQKQHLENLPEPLTEGEALAIKAAPRVAGSKTYWLLEVMRDDEPLM